MGPDVFGFPLNEWEFCIIGKEVLTTFCKEMNIFYCSLFLLSVRVRVSFFYLNLIIFFFFVFLFPFIAEPNKWRQVGWLDFTFLWFFLLFSESNFFHFFNTVSFVFVHVGLLRILELRPKIALRFTWVWVLI